MRFSQGSRSIFWSGSASLPPWPPKRVRVGVAVSMYESYCLGQFTPHLAGSVVSAVTSTSVRLAPAASCLRSKMFIRSAVMPAAASATTATTATSKTVEMPRWACEEELERRFKKTSVIGCRGRRARRVRRGRPSGGSARSAVPGPARR